MTPAEFLHWRLHMNLSRRKAAILLGISQTTAARYEHGQSKIPIMLPLAITSLTLDLPPWPLTAQQFKDRRLSPTG